MTSSIEVKGTAQKLGPDVGPNIDAQQALARSKEFTRYPQQNAFTDALHVSLNGERPFTIETESDLTRFDNVFPSNYNALLDETAGKQIRDSLIMEMLCRISRVAIISYPRGLKMLETVLRLKKYSYSRTPDKNLDLSSLATSFKTFVNLSLYVPSTFQGVGSLDSCLEISFARQRMNNPDNRFGEKWGSQNFVTVTFSLPHISLHDLLSHTPTSDMSLQDFQLACQKSWFLACTTESKFSSKLSKQERQRVVDATQDFVHNNIGGDINFLYRTWRLLSCNIAGVQNRRYVYTCFSPFQIMDWALCLGNPIREQQIFDENACMKILLRMGLLNTTCVKGIDAERMKDCKVLLCDDIHPPHEKTIALNDGCGRISVEMARLVVNGYKENFPQPLEEMDKPTLHSARERTEADFLLSSCDHVTCPSSWLTPDLPDPKSLRVPKSGVPSAFQIRYAGCKGMVVIDPSLVGCQLVIYKSMMKFITRSDDPILGAFYVAGMSLSKEQSVTLSSELLMMFEGTCRCDAREELVQYLTEITVDKRQDCQGKPLSDMLRDPQVGVDLMKRRYDTSNKDFLKSQTFVSYIFRLNAPLPLSANMYGVACFQTSLRSHEVFLQVLTQDGYKVITGPVLIAKPPCLKPSDLVLFTAVDRPELHHLYDVVVFSTFSDILVTSQVSNADLDGDHFSIMWDPRLLNLLECEQARKDTVNVPIHPEPLDTKLTQDAPRSLSGLSHVSRHWQAAINALRQPINSVKYCSLYHLLELRRRFLDVKSWDWPQDPLLLELAEMIKKTLEAPKHGVWVEWSELRHLPDKLPPLPHHYKRSNGLTSRHSTSLVGQLYDALLRACCNNSIQATTSLADELSFWTMFYKHAIGRGIVNAYSRDTIMKQEAVLRSIYKGKSIPPNDFIQALAFFQVAPTSEQWWDEQWQHSVGIVTSYKAPLQLLALADGLERNDHGILLTLLCGALQSPKFFSDEGIPLYPRFWKFAINILDSPQHSRPQLQTYCKLKYALLISKNPMGHACMFNKQIYALRRFAIALQLEVKDFNYVPPPVCTSPLPGLESSSFQIAASTEAEEWCIEFESFFAWGGIRVCFRTIDYFYVAFSTKIESEIAQFDDEVNAWLQRWHKYRYVARWHMADVKFPMSLELDNKYVTIWQLQSFRTLEDDYALYILHNLEAWCGSLQLPQVEFLASP